MVTFLQGVLINMVNAFSRNVGQRGFAGAVKNVASQVCEGVEEAGSFVAGELSGKNRQRRQLNIQQEKVAKRKAQMQATKVRTALRKKLRVLYNEMLDERIREIDSNPQAANLSAETIREFVVQNFMRTLNTNISSLRQSIQALKIKIEEQQKSLRQISSARGHGRERSSECLAYAKMCVDARKSGDEDDISVMMLMDERKRLKLTVAQARSIEKIVECCNLRMSDIKRVLSSNISAEKKLLEKLMKKLEDDQFRHNAMCYWQRRNGVSFDVDGSEDWANPKTKGL